MCNSLQPHRLQHARFPCPSPTPRACSNSHSLSRWCHPLSSPSPAFNLSQHQGLFQWVSSLHQVAKVLELQLQHQSFQWIFRTDFLYNWLVWSPCLQHMNFYLILPITLLSSWNWSAVKARQLKIIMAWKIEVHKSQEASTPELIGQHFEIAKGSDFYSHDSISSVACGFHIMVSKMDAQASNYLCLHSSQWKERGWGRPFPLRTFAKLGGPQFHLHHIGQNLVTWVYLAEGRHPCDQYKKKKKKSYFCRKKEYKIINQLNRYFKKMIYWRKTGNFCYIYLFIFVLISVYLFLASFSR